MIKVRVDASRQYDVIIDRGILSDVASAICEVHDPCVAVIISDSNVWPIYGSKIQKNLESAGFGVIHYVFPAGESSKNTATYLSILDFLAENKVTRSDLIIALGGGVTGDMAGFTAATYLRGIAYIQIPTSLLAMVDSSVGGKTAIDLPGGKNLVGAFYQPKLVLCDMDSLKTLPNHYFIDGCAEVIKYAILYDRSLFDHLMDHGQAFDTQYVISRCITLKKDVVAADEFDKGARQMLNLGHTFGHSIEKLSDFSMTHGYAVAIGMYMAAKAGVFLGICDQTTLEQISNILQLFKFPTASLYDSKQMADIALSDKKRFGETINLIIPQKIGKCIIHKQHISDLETIFKAGK